MLKELMAITKGPKNLRPALIGPTGSGKTARVEQISKETGLPFVHLLLAHYMPEEIGGLPRLTKDQVEYKLPEWAMEAIKTPHIIFLDELDKARKETVGSVLTLLWDLKLRDVHLHPETQVVVAMQPISARQFLSSETGRAFSARCIWLPLDYDWRYVSAATGLELSDMPSPGKSEAPLLPIPSPRQVEEGVRLYRKTANPDLRKAILAGIFPADLASRMEEKLELQAPVTVMDVADALAEKKIQVSELSIPELTSMSGILASRPDVQTYGDALYKVWTEGVEEDASAFLKEQYEFLKPTADENEDVDFLGELSAEEVVPAMNNVAKAIGTYWTETNKGNPAPQRPEKW